MRPYVYHQNKSVLHRLGWQTADANETKCGLLWYRWESITTALDFALLTKCEHCFAEEPLEEVLE